MSELIEIILQAVDNASNVFSSVTDSVTGMADSLSGTADTVSSDFTSMEENVTGFQTAVSSIDSSSLDELANELGMSTEEVERLIDAGAQIGSIQFNEAAAGAGELEASVSSADTAVEDLGSDLDIINSSMLLQLSEQVGQVGAQAEGMAQDMNTAAISVGQLATQTGIAEPQMVSLINNISNATFPNDEAMMYVKSLDQMGVSAENLGTSATNIDRINDAFGLGAQTTNSLAQELGVLGVDMNNVSSSFNALAYANSNTVGGMQNYYTFLRKYDSQFKELGFDVDQSSMIIAAATQKYGGGRAALSGLSSALEECDGDTRKLEQALGMQAGSLDHASEITGQYEGQLQQLADEEAEHKTLTDQLGSAWEDVSLSLSGVLSPLGSFVGLIGSAGSFALQINGLKTLTDTMKGFNLQQTITNALEGEGAIARVASALGITTEAAAAEGATVAFWGLAIAEDAALWSILAIAAAIAALIIVVYEVGKAFGWWDDVGGMLDAISAGLNRLWEAFINNPDVQAFITAISDAWTALSSAVQPAIDAVLSFFGVNMSGNFDIVRALIDAIGFAWNAITAPIRLVIGLIWQVINVFQALISGQITLQQAIILIWGAITTYWRTILTRLASLLTSTFTRMVNTARAKARAIVTGVINILTGLPGKALNLLLKVVNSINSAGGQWVSNARTKARSIVSAVTGQVNDLPGKVYTEFMNIGKRMLSAGSSLVKNAKKIGQQIVNGLLDSMGIHSPGIIQEKVIQEFEDTVSNVGRLAGSAGVAGGLVGSSIVGGFEEAATDLSNGRLFDARSGAYIVEEAESTINLNETLTLDLKNVPSNLDSDELMRWLKGAVGDKGLIRTLVENKDFQALDTKMKQTLAKKSARRM